jgi:ADP-heptose:LPS heptosyltransferase
MTNAPLLEVAARLKNCSTYLGNDSGVTHLAAMLGVPTIALFGPSNPHMWRPVGPWVQVLYNPELENILVEVVLDTLTKGINYNNLP